MKNCIFCSIVTNKAKHFRIYEDDLHIAFLDMHPYTWGHTLLIPKNHYRWIWDIPQLDKFILTTQKIITHYQTITHQKSAYVLSIGELISHAHFHILPRTDQGKDAISSAVRAMRKDPLDAETASTIHQKLTMTKP